MFHSLILKCWLAYSVLLFIFWGRRWVPVFIHFVFSCALHTFLNFHITFYLDAKFSVIDHNINHHMENFKIFYLYWEISSINYENIAVRFFTISFVIERLGGELTGKFCGAMQACFKTLPKSSDNFRFVHLSFQV